MSEIKVELLAPAGDFECVKAAINAGADAVYTGGYKFGARAGASNLSEEELIDAIDYAHMHGCSLYLTINTLFKEEELKEELIPYLSNLYSAGLDAVIVQDIGAIKLIREVFPDLPVHVSTQATINGAYTAKVFADMGTTRIVTPRELSLDEIKNIKKQTDIEIESFIHGALCYCYSGQCLLSSMIGARSGNRGRCAQPCRMEYSANNQNSYMLSTKDMCCINILPEIIESGVYSLKIEGRMKKPIYVAGVVSIYRKYIDYYLNNRDDFINHKKTYKVDDKDYNCLLSLFNRNGFNESYYNKHNGKDMMSLTKPEFRAYDKELVDDITNRYINTLRKEPISLKIEIKADKPINVEAIYCNNPRFTINLQGKKCDKAQNRSLTKEEVIKQFSKLGNTLFYLDSISVDLDEGLFLSVGDLKNLRREAIEKLCEVIINSYHRELNSTNTKEFINSIFDKHRKSNTGIKSNTGLSSNINVLIRSTDQFFSLVNDSNYSLINRIYIEEYLLDIISNDLSKYKNIFLALPLFIHLDKREVLLQSIKRSIELGIKGFLIRNFEELEIIKQVLESNENFVSSESNGNSEVVISKSDIHIVYDHNIYAMNSLAICENIRICKEYGFKCDFNMPLELNSKELNSLGDYDNNEFVCYGRVPVMTSANCVIKNNDKCNRNYNGFTYIKDRLKNSFPVYVNCKYCQNTIYNSKPTVLLNQYQEINRLNPKYLRLDFTDESGKKTLEIINEYMINSDIQSAEKELFGENGFTRGHFTRGVK